MIGANQLSDRNLGYEITKKLRTILSPSDNSRGEIFRALGAMTSFNSKTPASYISCGKIGAIDGVLSFFFRKSNSPINLV